MKFVNNFFAASSEIKKATPGNLPLKRLVCIFGVNSRKPVFD